MGSVFIIGPVTWFVVWFVVWFGMVRQGDLPVVGGYGSVAALDTDEGPDEAGAKSSSEGGGGGGGGGDGEDGGDGASDEPEGPIEKLFATLRLPQKQQ